jgi:hypothetical protein
MMQSIESYYGQGQGGIIIFNSRNNLYYNLDDVAALVWNLIQQPRTVDEICDEVRRTFGHMDRELCERDVRTLLADMEREGLIESERNERVS